MSQKSIQANVGFTAVMVALLSMTTVALAGQSESLRGKTLLASAERVEKTVDLTMMPGNDGVMKVKILNQTGSDIVRGSVLIDVAFATGVSQETRINFANLGRGQSSPVELKLVNDKGNAEISTVKVLASSFKTETQRALRAPVKVHYDQGD